MEISEIILRVHFGIEWYLVPAISISPVNGLNANLSCSSDLIKNESWVKLLISWIHVIRLSVVTIFDILIIELISFEKVRNIANVSFCQLLSCILIIAVCFIELEPCLVCHEVTSSCEESGPGCVISPILRIFLDLWQILLHKIN